MDVLDKIERKHNVREYEIYEIFANYPKFRLVEKGHRTCEHVYSAIGRTHAGRYLNVFFIYKKSGIALVQSAY